MGDNDFSPADLFGEIADECVEAFRQGQCPWAEQFARRNPAHADDVREMLPASGLMGRLVPRRTLPVNGARPTRRRCIS